MSPSAAQQGNAMLLLVRRLMRPTLLVFGANMLRAGCAFLVTMVAARLLGPAEFGQLSTFLTLTIFAFALIGEGFDPGVVRFFARAIPAGPEATHRVLGSALVLRIALAVPMLALFWGAGAMWLTPETAPIARLAAVAAIAAGLSSLSLAVLQANERFFAYVWLAPLTNLVRLLALPVLWLAGALTLAALVWTHVLAFALTVVAGFWLLRDHWRRVRFDAATLRELLAFGTWSALANGCYLLIVLLPVPLLTQIRGANEGGLYSAAATLLMVIDQYTAALVTSRMAATSRIDTLRDLRKFARHLAPRLLLTGSALCLVYPLAPAIISLVFGSAYGVAAEVMRALLPGFVITLVTHPLCLVLYARERPHWYAYSALVSLIIFAVLATWWLPAFGLIGMAWATSGARAAQAAIIVAMVLATVRKSDPAGRP